MAQGAGGGVSVMGIVDGRAGSRMNTNPLSEFLASCAYVLLIDESEITIRSVGCDGDTPLHVALWQGRTDIVHLLIEAGADVNAVGDMSETPLHVAVRQQSLQAVKAILNSGASCHFLSEFGQSPKGLAVEMGGGMKEIFAGR